MIEVLFLSFYLSSFFFSCSLQVICQLAGDVNVDGAHGNAFLLGHGDVRGARIRGRVGVVNHHALARVDGL